MGSVPADPWIHMRQFAAISLYIRHISLYMRHILGQSDTCTQRDLNCIGGMHHDSGGRHLTCISRYLHVQRMWDRDKSGKEKFAWHMPHLRLSTTHSWPHHYTPQCQERIQSACTAALLSAIHSRLRFILSGCRHVLQAPSGRPLMHGFY